MYAEPTGRPQQRCGDSRGGDVKSHSERTHRETRPHHHPSLLFRSRSGRSRRDSEESPRKPVLADPAPTDEDPSTQNPHTAHRIQGNQPRMSAREGCTLNSDGESGESEGIEANLQGFGREVRREGMGAYDSSAPEDELARAAVAGRFVDLDADQPRLLAQPVDPAHTALPSAAHARAAALVRLRHLLLRFAAVA